MEYLMAIDHDEVNGTLDNLTIIDNTNYPNTLDPTKKYTGVTESLIIARLGLQRETNSTY